MFSGIIETFGRVAKIEQKQGNLILWIAADFVDELKVDQSIAHNGCCLTVEAVEDNLYRVCVIAESLERTNLGSLAIDDLINLERCIRLSDRLDGHMVQGHVDQRAKCIKKIESNGSWVFGFEYSPTVDQVVVQKGSICVNGVSLTIASEQDNQFEVAIIPYTYKHTNFKQLKVGDSVNLEFDIIGKYVAKMMWTCYI